MDKTKKILDDYSKEIRKLVVEEMVARLLLHFNHCNLSVSWSDIKRVAIDMKKGK